MGRQGWIALSHNKAIRRTAIERDAAMRAGLALFFLIGKRNDDVLANLIATVPSIIQFREMHEPPFIARVTRPDSRIVVGSRPGIVEMSLTRDQWLAAFEDEDA